MATAYNFDPQSDDLYKRLGIPENAVSDEIKRAFFTAVTHYPPEKEAKNYKAIREAYDALVNPRSREEYNTRRDFGPELEKLENELNSFDKDENLDGQIRILKRILNLAPNMTLYRNKLGLIFLDKEKPEDAITQFEKANKMDTDNPVFILNMGHAEEGMENYRKAEKYYLKAWELDNEDYAPPRALARLYHDKLDQKRKAHQILDKAIEADGKIDFQDFFCIYDKIYFYSLDHNKAGLQRELDRVKEIAKSEEDKEFAGFMLASFAAQLFEYKLFDLSIKFLETAHYLCPNDKNINQLYIQTKKEASLLDNISKVMDSGKVHEMVKFLVSLYAQSYYGDITQAQFRMKFDESKGAIIGIMDTDPASTKVKDSLRYIRQSYKDVFELNGVFFDRLIDFPSPTNYSEKCPHCSEYVKVTKHQYSTYTCPHCGSTIKYGSSGYTKGGGYGGGGDGGGCFIATEVYADYNNQNVLALRKFRDNILQKHLLGKAFISTYYKIGPFFADLLSYSPFFKKVVKRILNKVVDVIKK